MISELLFQAVVTEENCKSSDSRVGVYRICIVEESYMDHVRMAAK
jgi:hypothetical protein